MSAQLNVINDTLNLLRGKTVRFILEDVDLRMIRNLVDMIDEMDLVYDQEKMIYVDPHRETRGAAHPADQSLMETLIQEEQERLERNRKAREKYHAKKKGQKPKKRGRPRKGAK